MWPHFPNLLQEICLSTEIPSPLKKVLLYDGRCRTKRRLQIIFEEWLVRSSLWIFTVRRPCCLPTISAFRGKKLMMFEARMMLPYLRGIQRKRHQWMFEERLLIWVTTSSELSVNAIANYWLYLVLISWNVMTFSNKTSFGHKLYTEYEEHIKFTRTFNPLRAIR
jgi:hypothetical protein